MSERLTTTHELAADPWLSLSAREDCIASWREAARLLAAERSMTISDDPPHDVRVRFLKLDNRFGPPSSDVAPDEADIVKVSVCWVAS